jgi:hypothetical protein
MSASAWRPCWCHFVICWNATAASLVLIAGSVVAEGEGDDVGRLTGNAEGLGGGGGGASSM